MNITYKGNNSGFKFYTKKGSINLEPLKSVEITDDQAKELKSRKFVKKLIDKGIIEFSETKSEKPDTKTEKPLDDHTKDELLDIVKELKLEDITSKNTKAEIITAIEDARK